MPTYEYACKACEHGFEVVQSFSEDALTTCPECGRDELRKVFSAAGIIFKGDGWHIKDYAAKDSKTSSASADSGSDTTAKKSKDTKAAGSGSSSSGSSAAAVKPAAG